MPWRRMPGSSPTSGTILNNEIPIDNQDNLEGRVLDSVSSLGKPVSVRELVRGLRARRRGPARAQAASCAA